MRPTLAIYGIQDRLEGKHPGYVHDHSLALMQDGKTLKFLQLERITRRKHDEHIYQYIEDWIESKILDLPEEFDVIFVDSFVGRAFISKSGRIRFEAPLAKNLYNGMEEGFCWWYDKKITGYVLNHELAHIYSCVPFYGMFRNNSLLIHFDGGASQGNFSAWLYRDEKIYPIEYHWDMVQLSKYFNNNALNFAILGMKQDDHISVAGKLMGYAAYGKPDPKIREWLQENDYFQNIWQNLTPFFMSAKKNFGWDKEFFSTEDPFLQNIAASFQEDFCSQFLLKLMRLQEKFQCTYLYLSGGCALNIVTNTAIDESGLFKEIFIRFIN